MRIFDDLRSGLAPAVEELRESWDRSYPEPLRGRELAVEAATAAAFAAVATGMAIVVPPDSTGWGLLSEVGRIVRSSHEKWDGTGYPDGLVAEAIPVESTIVSCCDAFNAMTTDRSYRAAMSLEEAIDELQANAGTQFNPAVVEALMRVLTADPLAAGARGPRVAAVA